MFVKFQGMNQVPGVDGQLHWGRADLDGAPYIGPQLPLLKEEEAEQLLERAYDSFYGTFDTSQPDQLHAGHRLQDVIDRSTNGWYKIMSWQEKWGERDGVPVMFIFVVWCMPAMKPNSAALRHGTNFLPIGS